MSTNMYSIHNSICNFFDIDPSNPIPNSIFENISEMENIVSVITGTFKNQKHTEESKLLISKAHKGMKKPWLNRNLSDEHKEKIKKYRTGKSRPEMNKEKLKLIGKNRTEHQKQAAKNHSEKMKGRNAPNKKSIIFRGIKFESITDAMKYFHVSYNKIINEIQ